MTAPGAAYVPNEVIASKLDSLTTEVRELRRELVRRDVYEAERRADALELNAVRVEMTAVKTELAGAASRRWGVWLAGIAAGLSLLVQVGSKLLT